MPIPRSLLKRDAPVDHDLTVRHGVWPADLSGELIISAPHPDTLDGPHAFFGDGMTYRLSLSPGLHGAATDSFAWRQKRIDSPSARLRRARPDVFTSTMLGVHSPFGLTNAANTAPLPWGDRLFMTWDVGRPVEVDPLTLGFLGEVGHRSEWIGMELFPQPVLPMVTSTAHPVIDPDRDVLWLDAIDKKAIPRSDLNSYTVRQLQALKSPEVSAKLQRVWGEIRPASVLKGNAPLHVHTPALIFRALEF